MEWRDKTLLSIILVRASHSKGNDEGDYPTYPVTSDLLYTLDSAIISTLIENMVSSNVPRFSIRGSSPVFYPKLGKDEAYSSYGSNERR